MKEEVLPEVLNDRGCILLCQNLVVKAIEDGDDTFFNTELGIIAKKIAIRKNNYNIDKIITLSLNTKLTINSKKYDSKVLAEESQFYDINQLADMYHCSKKSMKVALSKRHIAYGCKKPQHRLAENGQLEFVFC